MYEDDERRICAILDEALENGNTPYFDIILDDFFLTDSEGITYLEKFAKKKIHLYSFQKEIVRSKEALLILLKNNHWTFLTDFDENTLFEKVDDKLLIEYFLASDENLYSVIRSVKQHIEIIEYLIKYNKNFYLSDEIITKLFSEDNGKFPIDQYENTKYFDTLLENCPYDLRNAYCKSKNRIDLIAKFMKEDDLLSLNENGETNLESFLKQNISPGFWRYDFKQQETLNILIKYKRYDLLYNALGDLLLKQYDETKTYLDLMIMAYLDGVNVHFEDMYLRTSNEVKAKVYITLAKHGLAKALPPLKDWSLINTNNGQKTILEYLIELDKDLAIEKIIPSSELSKPRVAFYLRKLGIYDTTVDLPKYKRSYADTYIDVYNQKQILDESRLDPSYLEFINKKLSELNDLYINDRNSDQELVEFFISTCRQVLLRDSTAIKDIDLIIAIKKKYPDKLSFIKTEGTARFVPGEGNVYLNNSVTNTLIHEVTHALHYFLADSRIMDNYNELIEKVRNNPETISKVKKYSDLFRKLKRSASESISQIVSDYIDKIYDTTAIRELEEFLESDKEKRKKEFEKSYDEKVLDIILDDTYNIEEYLQQQKKIQIEETIDAILRCSYGSFISIGDFIDAIFLGKFKDNLLTENKEFIPSAFGHGHEYYLNPIHGFDEMIANYGAILKSSDSEEIIKLLRSIIGDELVDAIDSFYRYEILGSKRLTYEDDFESLEQSGSKKL